MIFHTLNAKQAERAQIVPVLPLERRSCQSSSAERNINVDNSMALSSSHEIHH